ncbi:MAG: hypothetical protein H6838_17370 [Planctomycetes bacterium]|nr:hypothetical protein [Planctomycetota bacterium]
MGWVSAKNEKVRGEIARLLLAVPTRDLAAGWHLCADLGQPAAPLLWELLAEERSNVGRRLALLAGAVLAGGPNEDDRLFAFLALPRPMLEERCLAMMLVALGPQRSRAMPEFWSKSLGPAKTPEQLMAIVVRLAAARFPGTDAGAPGLADGDPGVATAAAFAGLPVPGSIAGPLWNLKTPARHAELFWRGAFLGAGRGATPATGAQVLRERAREVASLPGASFAAARGAATLLRARLHDYEADTPRLEFPLLELATIEAANARALRTQLSAAPSPLVEDPRRLSVAYVLSRSVTEVVAARDVWGANTKVNRHIAVALAWRLAGEAGAAPLGVQIPDLPEWYLARWAAGDRVGEPPTFEDEQLTMGARLAAAGRLPAAAARRLFEETLWRWGSHPGLGAWEQERLLLRDVLLVGSHPGGGKYVPQVRPELRYRPAGLGPDDVFYDVAVALFDFLATPRGPVPAEYQLR